VCEREKEMEKRMEKWMDGVGMGWLHGVVQVYMSQSVRVKDESIEKQSTYSKWFGELRN